MLFYTDIVLLEIFRLTHHATVSKRTLALIGTTAAIFVAFFSVFYVRIIYFNIEEISVAETNMSLINEYVVIYYQTLICKFNNRYKLS